MTDKCAVAGCWTAAIPEQTRGSGASIATNSHPAIAFYHSLGTMKAALHFDIEVGTIKADIS